MHQHPCVVDAWVTQTDVKRPKGPPAKRKILLSISWFIYLIVGTSCTSLGNGGPSLEYRAGLSNSRQIPKRGVWANAKDQAHNNGNLAGSMLIHCQKLAIGRKPEGDK